MPSTANQLEHRSLDRHARNIINTHQAKANQQITYATAAAKHQDNNVIVYKAATFHTVDKDSTYCYPFEDIPYLLITGRHSGATLPKNEIVFRHIYERGQAATRETLQACRSYAIHAIRKRLDIALHHDQMGDPVIVVTKKDKSINEWHLTGDIRVRFPSKRSVLSAYNQQRALVRHADDGNNRLLTHDGHISPILIPSKHVGNESFEASLHKAYVSCELLRGKDNGELSAIFRDNLKETYEDMLLSDKDEYIPPTDFIDTFITVIEATESSNAREITLTSTNLLYLFEFSKIFKVGGISSPYAVIEWHGVQIPQAITRILQKRGIKLSLVNNDGEYQDSTIYFYERNPAGKGREFDEFPAQKSDFLRYGV